MKNNTKVLWTVVAAVIAIIIIGYAIHIHKVRQMPSVSDDTQVQNSQNGNSLVSTEDISTGSIHAAPSGMQAPVLGYEQALAEYASRRVQFDTNCQAKPANATFKNGVTLMLDNRSPEARTIHMGSFGDYSVKAWGFKIVSLTSAVLPNAMAVDCNSLQNVAIITLQK
jgi:hypothetical protein